MHSRSLKTIDTRIPTMPRRSTSGFHRPGRYCVHQAQSGVRFSASRMKGELYSGKKHLRGGLPHLVRTLLLMDDSFEVICLFSGVATSRDSNGDTVYLPRGWLTTCTLRGITPLTRSYGLALRTIWSNSTTISVTA